jgi:hypothetical protein
VHCARALYCNALNEIVLRVATSRDARRAGSNHTTPLQKVCDESAQRIERWNVSQINRALANESTEALVRNA